MDGIGVHILSDDIIGRFGDTTDATEIGNILGITNCKCSDDCSVNTTPRNSIWDGMARCCHRTARIHECDGSCEHNISFRVRTVAMGNQADRMLCQL